MIFYVNDILLASNDIGLFYKTKKFLSKDIDVKDLGDVSFTKEYRYIEILSVVSFRISQKIYIDKDYVSGDMPIG